MLTQAPFDDINNMAMINKTRIRKLRNVEFLQFLADILMVCDTSTNEAMTLAVFITAVSENYEKFAEAFRVSRGSTITEILEDLDEQRDDCLRGLRHILKGCSFHFDADIREAGERLLHEMDKYGTNIPGLNYPTKTITVRSIYEDCTTKPQPVADVALLQLGPWLNELQSVNTSFNDSFTARVAEKGSKADVKTYACRKAAIASYRTLADQINARAIFMGDGSYDHLINTINSLVKNYNRIADSHKRKKNTPPQEN